MNDRRFLFPIGTQFTTRHKHPKTCVVVDRLTTRNESGDIVSLKYVCTHQFMGQTLTSYDVPETTIAMGNPIIPEQ
jgi:hypothetical protein